MSVDVVSASSPAEAVFRLLLLLTSIGEISTAKKETKHLQMSTLFVN